MRNRPLLALLTFFIVGTLCCAAEERAIRVALFDDAGSSGKGVPLVARQLGAEQGIAVTKLKGAEIAAGRLKDFDVVIFTGGSGSAQAKTIGGQGREEVREFVRRGGGYVGICAGAYLACSGFDWGVGVLDAKTVSNKWQRGVGEVEMELTPDGEKVTGLPATKRGVHYANGPIIEPNERADIPDYEVLAWFRSELAENQSPVGKMVNSPAIARASFGKGRVLVSSPHPEQTAGMESVVASAVRWMAAGMSDSANASTNSSVSESGGTKIEDSLRTRTSVESSPRTLLAAAERLLRETSPETTTYKHNTPEVHWSDGGEDVSYCRTDCSGLLMALMEHCQPGKYDASVYQRWLGARRPNAARFYDAIAAERGFRLVPKLAELQLGDMIAIKFPAGSSNSGHTMLAADAPRPCPSPVAPIIDGVAQWQVTVLDASAAGHGPGDTRYLGDGKTRTGLGKGLLRLYVKPDGTIVGYTMSPDAKAPYHPVEIRPIAIGRFDPGYEP
jgi:glutamine amidotransferase-like uncharacterized protein